MDPQADIRDGVVLSSPELERRVKCFKEWHDGYGEIILQQNVEDTRLRSAEYAIEKLGVNCIELKWGQGAKNIGGEVKLKTMERADELKKRGYIVVPDPTIPRCARRSKKRNSRNSSGIPGWAWWSTTVS